MDSTSKKINFYIQLQLKLLIISTMLFVYKYIYINRINQETFLRLFVIVAFSLWLLKLIIVEELSWEETKLNIPILLFVLVMAISLLKSEIIFIGLKDLINFLAYFLIFFLVINCVNNKKQLFSFIALNFVVAFIIAFYTFIQYYGFDPIFKELHNLTSTLGQKNWISNYIAISFLIAFPFFLLKKEKRLKIIYYILLSILYANIMICQSRGIWISIGLSSIIGIFLLYKYRLFIFIKENRKWFILLLITFIIITFIYSTDNPLNKSALTTIQRAVSIFDKSDVSINTRLLIWKTTFNMIKDNPLFGLGIGAFKKNYLGYQANFLNEHPEYTKYWIKAGEAHNEYLQIWAELGIVGLGLFLVIIYFYYKLVLYYLKKERESEKKIIVVGLFTGITCFLIHALFSFPLHVPALGAAFFILLGLNIRFIQGFNFNDEYKQNSVLKIIKFKGHKFKIIFIVLIIVLATFTISNVVVKPYLSELYYFKGMLFNLSYNFNSSLPLFRQAVDLDPQNGRIVHALGATYYNLSRYDEAIESFQIARRYEIDTYTFFLLGLCYFNKEMYKEAEEELKSAIYIEPKFTEGYHYLGLLYFQQEDYDKAVEQWNKILEIEPDFPNKYIVLNNLGIVYQKKEMPDKALEYFIQALYLVPEGDPIEKEIEEEINKIYKSKLEN